MRFILYFVVFIIAPLGHSQSTKARNFYVEFNSSFNTTLNLVGNSASMPGFGFGALIELRKTNPFRISSGLEFNQTSIGLNNTNTSGKNASPLTTKMAKMQFISLPINFNRYFGTMQRMVVSGGFVIDYMIKTERSVLNILGVESLVNSDSRVINFAPTIGVGWVFPTNRVQFVLKSDVRLGIFPLFDGGSNGDYGANHYARLVFGVKF